MRSCVSVCTIDTGIPSSRPNVTNRCSSVSQTVVLVGEGGAVEDLRGIDEIEPMDLQVALALNLVPGKPHGATVYSYRIYVNTLIKRDLAS